MQKQKTYLTQDGHKVIATFYRANVSWYTVGKPMSNGTETIAYFYVRAAARGWREIEST